MLLDWLPEAKKFCSLFSLKSGTIIIAVVNILESLVFANKHNFTFTKNIGANCYGGLSNDKCPIKTAMTCVAYFMFFICFIVFLLSVFLILAVFIKSRFIVKWFLYMYCLETVLFFAVDMVALVAYLATRACRVASDKGMLFCLILPLGGIMLHSYFVIVVNSYRLKLESRRPVRLSGSELNDSGKPAALGGERSHERRKSSLQMDSKEDK